MKEKINSIFKNNLDVSFENLKTLSNREINWVLFQISKEVNFNILIKLPPLETRENNTRLLKSHFDTLPNKEEFIKKIYLNADNFPDKKNYDWLNSSSKRANMISRLISLLDNKKSYYTPFHPQQQLRFEECEKYFYYIIDTSNIDLREKLTTIERSRTNSANFNASLQKIDFKWIASPDDEQLQWTWEYLVKKNAAIQWLVPYSSDEYYVCILCSIYSLDVPHEAVKREFITKLKKAWSQEKYRKKNKGIIQMYAPMSKDVADKLRIIGKTERRYTYAILEELISTRYDQIKHLVPPYLTRKGRDK